MREPESTDFIAAIPTVWDESIVLDGKMGEYIVTARRKGDVWYIGGITDWTARDIEVDCSFWEIRHITPLYLKTESMLTVSDVTINGNLSL